MSEKDEGNLTGGKGEQPPVERHEEFDATLMDGGADATIPYRGDSTAVSGQDRAAADAAASTLPDAGEPELFAQRFELVKVIGEGGMGRVYQARDTYVDNREVALKVLIPRYSRNENFRQLFFREIKTAQRFVSEHVNQVRDTGQTDDGTLYLTMDLVKGEDLSDVLVREATLNVRRALDVTLQVLMGLRSGHEVGFVHRDIKPSNIMLARRITKTDDNPFGVGVRLLDFGIAGLAAEIEEGELIGTPTYMSPEQVQGERLDARSDLFAVGVVLYEMIAGSRPFQGQTIADITESILETDVDPLIHDLSQLSKPLQALLSKALAKDRDKRFQSADEFITTIEKSKAYRLPKVMPIWAAASLVLLAGAAATEGFLLSTTWATNSELEASYDRLDGDYRELGRTTDTRIAALDTEIKRLLARDIEGVDVRVDQEEVERLRAEATRLENERDSALGERDSAYGERDGANSRLSEKERENIVLNTRVTELEGQVSALRVDLETFQSYNDPHFVIAKRYDETLLQQWAQGMGERSGASLDNLLEGDPVNGILPGEKYLRDVANLVGGIEQFRVNAGDTPFEESARAASIDRIALLVDPVRTGLEAFALEANDWLWYGADPRREQGERAPRVAAMDALLNDKRGVLDQAAAALASVGEERDAAWNRISSGDPLQSPSAVTVFASRYGEGYLVEELVRFADALNLRIGPNGTLDPDALRALESIPAWAELIDKRPALERTSSARTVRQFHHAYRWFTEPAYLGQDLDRTLFVAQPAASGPPDAGWTVELGLMHDLVQPGSAFPAPAGGRQVYRLTYKTNGQTVWRKARQERTTSDYGAIHYEVRVEQFSGDGSTKHDEFIRKVERRGKIFVDSDTGEQLVNLGGKSVLEVATRKIDVSRPPPAQLVSQSEWRKFLAELESEGAVCLVTTTNGTERWISPRYGLVFEENATSTLELVYGSYAR